MDTLLLKLVLTPALIGAASLAGRRFGPVVSGWLVGFPFTSAPIAFFLALSHGTAFAAGTATGTMAGAVSQAAFSVAYGWAAPRHGWPVTVAVSCLAFAASTAALSRVALSPLPLFAIVLAILALAIHSMPGSADAPRAPTTEDRRARHATSTATRSAQAPPPWDLPLRMAVATVFVIALTAFAPALGPRLTGLLAPFPLYAAVLAVFAHHQSGPAPAVGVLRGLLVGLFAFAGFFLVLTLLLERVGVALAFAAAIALALAVQAGALWTLKRTRGQQVDAAGASDRLPHG
jgi:hypothetical protein